MAYTKESLFRSACLGAPFLVTALIIAGVTEAQGSAAGDVCAPVRTDLDAVPFNLVAAARHARAAFDVDDTAECVPLATSRIEMWLGTATEGLHDDDLTLMGAVADPTDAGAFPGQLDAIDEALRPVIERLHLRSLARVIAQLRRRVRDGLDRGRAVAPFDFRRAVFDVETHHRAQTCDVSDVWSMRPAAAYETPPGGRSVRLTLFCRAAGTSIAVNVWLLPGEAEAALAWSAGIWLGLRVIAVDSIGHPEATVDPPRTAVVSRLREGARERERVREAEVMAELARETARRRAEAERVAAEAAAARRAPAAPSATE